jgi:hypothetical protein
VLKHNLSFHPIEALTHFATPAYPSYWALDIDPLIHDTYHRRQNLVAICQQQQN